MSLNGISKKQDAVSHSTPEAELVAAAFAIRREGLPSAYIWDLILRSDNSPNGKFKEPKSKTASPSKEREQIVTTFHEDNETMIRVCETGRNPTMRHLGRVHIVGVQWLHGRIGRHPDKDLTPVSYTHLTLPTSDLV